MVVVEEEEEEEEGSARGVSERGCAGSGSLAHDTGTRTDAGGAGIVEEEEERLFVDGAMGVPHTILRRGCGVVVGAVEADGEDSAKEVEASL